jgi:hypothetical protein
MAAAVILLATPLIGYAMDRRAANRAEERVEGRARRTFNHGSHYNYTAHGPLPTTAAKGVSSRPHGNSTSVSTVHPSGGTTTVIVGGGPGGQTTMGVTTTADGAVVLTDAQGHTAVAIPPGEGTIGQRSEAQMKALVQHAANDQSQPTPEEIAELVDAIVGVAVAGYGAQKQVRGGVRRVVDTYKFRRQTAALLEQTWHPGGDDGSTARQLDDFMDRTAAQLDAPYVPPASAAPVDDYYDEFGMEPFAADAEPFFADPDAPGLTGRIYHTTQPGIYGLPIPKHGEDGLFDEFGLEPFEPAEATPITELVDGHVTELHGPAFADVFGDAPLPEVHPASTQPLSETVYSGHGGGNVTTKLSSTGANVTTAVNTGLGLLAFQGGAMAANATGAKPGSAGYVGTQSVVTAVSQSALTGTSNTIAHALEGKLTPAVRRSLWIPSVTRGAEGAATTVALGALGEIPGIGVSTALGTTLTPAFKRLMANGGANDDVSDVVANTAGWTAASVGGVLTSAAGATILGGMGAGATALSELGPPGLIAGLVGGLGFGLYTVATKDRSTDPGDMSMHALGRQWADQQLAKGNITLEQANQIKAGQWDITGLVDRNSRLYHTFGSDHRAVAPVHWWSLGDDGKYTTQYRIDGQWEDDPQGWTAFVDSPQYQNAYHWEQNHPYRQLTPEVASLVQRHAWDTAIYNMTIDPATGEHYPKDHVYAGGTHDLAAQSAAANRQLALDYQDLGLDPDWFATNQAPELSTAEWSAWGSEQEGLGFFSDGTVDGSAVYLQMGQHQTWNQFVEAQRVWLTTN